MKTPTLTAIAITLAISLLTSCSYPSLEACEEAHGTCHKSITGNIVPGRGIDVNSPAGQAILSGVVGGMMHPAPSQPPLGSASNPICVRPDYNPVQMY